MSAVVLAGGKSSRMGADKAFLTFAGRTFISTITNELLKIFDQVVISTGRKNNNDFVRAVGNDKRVRLCNDLYAFENPLNGLLSAFESIRDEYCFVVACDSPLICKDVVRYLCNEAISHSAAIPIWDDTDLMTCEPLVGAYQVEETKIGIQKTIQSGRIGCKHVFSYLNDVKYVPVSDLRPFDPTLKSLINVNTPRDYEEMNARFQLDIPLLKVSR